MCGLPISPNEVKLDVFSFCFSVTRTKHSKSWYSVKGKGKYMFILRLMQVCNTNFFPLKQSCKKEDSSRKKILKAKKAGVEFGGSLGLLCLFMKTHVVSILFASVFSIRRLIFFASQCPHASSSHGYRRRLSLRKQSRLEFERESVKGRILLFERGNVAWLFDLMGHYSKIDIIGRSIKLSTNNNFQNETAIYAFLLPNIYFKFQNIKNTLHCSRLQHFLTS